METVVRLFYWHIGDRDLLYRHLSITCYIYQKRDDSSFSLSDNMLYSVYWPGSSRRSSSVRLWDERCTARLESVLSCRSDQSRYTQAVQHILYDWTDRVVLMDVIYSPTSSTTLDYD